MLNVKIVGARSPPTVTCRIVGSFSTTNMRIYALNTYICFVDNVCI